MNFLPNLAVLITNYYPFAENFQSVYSSHSYMNISSNLSYWVKLINANTNAGDEKKNAQHMHKHKLSVITL